MSSGVLSVHCFAFFSLLSSASSFHLRALNMEVHTTGSNVRMEPLFVNFFREMEKKSFHLFFVVINIVLFWSFVQLSFALVPSCLRAECVFSFIHTRSFSHVTGHEKSTKPNTLTHTRTRSNAHTQQLLGKKLFIVRFYRYASRVRQ